MNKLSIHCLSIALLWFATAACSTDVYKVENPNVLTVRQLDAQWWHSSVFYELWPRSFKDSDGDGSGDFAGMIEQLPYLKVLGVDAIWLTPVFEAPSYHGYDFQDFYAVESDYGSMEAFERFISNAHDLGMKVVLDLVLNHISDRHPWFIKSAAREPGFEDFFLWRDERPALWGVAWEDTPNPERVWHWHEGRGQYYYAAFSQSQPDLNMENPAVVEEIKNVTAFWINKGIDGFRLDAARMVVEENVNENEAIQADSEATLEFWADYREFVKSINPQVLLVAEAWADMETIGTYYDRGHGVDAAFDFDFGYMVAEILNQAQRQADFGSVSEQAFEGSSRSRIWNNLKARNENAPLLFYAPFLANHDQERFMHTLGNQASKARIAASLLLTSPGSVYLYYGEEIGLSQAKLGDDIYRRAIMQWEDNAYAGFNDSGNFWSDDGSWVPWVTDFKPWWSAFWEEQLVQGGHSVASQQLDPNSLWNHYRKLIAIRSQNPVISQPERLELIPCEDEQLWILKYRSGDDSLIVVINLSPSDRVELKLHGLGNGRLKDLYSDRLVDTGETLVLEPAQVMILK